jgi:hypothetical protein
LQSIGAQASSCLEIHANLIGRSSGINKKRFYIFLAGLSGHRSSFVA